MDDTGVSREHAVLLYDGVWRVRDLGSVNGTFVDGERVRDQAVVPHGATVRFGAEGDRWQLIEGGPPRPQAVSSSGRIAPSTATGLVLSGTESRIGYVTYQGNTWTLEYEYEVRRLTNNETLPFDGEDWTLELLVGEPVPLDQTSIANAATRFEFLSTRDEEHVELLIHNHHQTHRVSQRSHLYVLMLLARARLADQTDEGILVSEQGWLATQELASMLRTTNQQVNIWIWRARQHAMRNWIECCSKLFGREPQLGVPFRAQHQIAKHDIVLLGCLEVGSLLLLSLRRRYEPSCERHECCPEYILRRRECDEDLNCMVAPMTS